MFYEHSKPTSVISFVIILIAIVSYSNGIFGRTEASGPASHELLFGVSAIFLLFIMWKSYWADGNGKLLREIPGPTAYPLIGNMHLFAGSKETYMSVFTRFISTYGRRVKIWMGTTPVIILAQAQDIETVLASKVIHHRGRVFVAAAKWAMSDALLLLEDEPWKTDRQLLNQGFKYQKLDGYLDTFNKHGKILGEILGEKLKNEPQDLYPTLAMCTMDSILESGFGVESNLQRIPNSKLVSALHSAVESTNARILKPWLLNPLIWKLTGEFRKAHRSIDDVHDFFRTSIKERRRLTEEHSTEAEKSKPLLDALIVACRNEKSIFHHMTSMLLGGYETGAMGINYTLYLLAVHPEAQAKVHSEMDRVFGNDQKVPVTFAHLAELKYLEMCINEMLRLFPIFPMTFRSLQCDVQLDAETTLPKGTQVLLDFYHLHRDPNFFPDPEKFNPERFSVENLKTRVTGAYAPFGLGPKICIGQKYAMIQMKVVLTHILRQFTVSTNLNREDWVVIPGVFLQPSKELSLKLLARVKA